LREVNELKVLTAVSVVENVPPGPIWNSEVPLSIGWIDETTKIVALRELGCRTKATSLSTA
jgi:hypothetical protein